MKVNVYPADEGGCGHYRVRWPAEALQRQGADVEVIGAAEPEERQVMATWWSRGDERRLLDVRAPDADVIVLQRPLTDTLADSIPMLQAKGVRVVVEIDDDFEALSARNISWRKVQPAVDRRRNKDHLRRACERADLVVTSTPALARRYGAHGRVAVVPNMVPEAYFGIAKGERDDTFVGWSGSIATHPDDLQECGAGITRALRATGARFGVVGTGKGVQRALGLDEAPLACGWVPLAEYPTAMAQLDIGIVPLELSAFNEAKSWLKGLEFAALGVPFVASPTGPYRALHRAGAGLLAESPKQWEGIVKRLVREPDWRAEVAEAARNTARAMTIEGNCERWWEAWTAPLTAMVNTPCAV